MVEGTPKSALPWWFFGFFGLVAGWEHPRIEASAQGLGWMVFSITP